MFVDTTPTQLALANAIASQPRVTRAPITPVQEELVQLWYAVFQTGCIFGMPAALPHVVPVPGLAVTFAEVVSALAAGDDPPSLDVAPGLTLLKVSKSRQ